MKFLKQKRPETDNLALNKISGCEGKILGRNLNISRNANFFTSWNPLQKYSENVFAYSCVSEHSDLFFPYKTYTFLVDKGFAVATPNPLTDIFLDGFPKPRESLEECEIA